MVEKEICLPKNTPVEITLSVDTRGVLSLGIRINGSNAVLLAQGSIIPSPGNFRSWSKTIGELV
jgi:hypothetical protein